MTMKPWRPNHSNEMPRLLMFLDTESYRGLAFDGYHDGSLELRLGCVDYVNWRSRRSTPTHSMNFTSTNGFWEFLDECSVKKQVMWVFAHNLMFDLAQVCFGTEIEAGRLVLSTSDRQVVGKNGEIRKLRGFKGICSSTRHSTIITALYKGKRVTFCDSMNYFRCSLAELGQSVGLPKLPMPEESASNEEWFKYCRRDTEIVREAICGLLLEWEKNQRGNWQPTIASLSFSSYRHSHMQVAPIPHCDPFISMFESRAYKDGRTQLFWRGDIREPGAGGSVFGGYPNRDNRPWRDGPVFHLDVSSLYPSVMRDFLYPVCAIGYQGGKPSFVDVLSPQELQAALVDYLAVASVQLTTTEDAFPFSLPDRTIYPTGTFVTTLATPELLKALEMGVVKKVISAIFYRKANLFSNFVNYWVNRRYHLEQFDNGIGAEFCKIIVNSLAGKFGQRRHYWESIPGRTTCEQWYHWYELHQPTNTLLQFRSIGRQVQKLISDGWIDSAFVAVAAHVNSYARVRMLFFRSVAGRRDCYYQGNDSLLVTQVGYDRLIAAGCVADRELGKLRLVNRYSTASTWAARDYEVDGRVCKAGVPSSAHRLAERTWEFDSFEGSEQLLTRRPDGTVKTKKRTVHGTDPLEVLRWDESGWYLPPVINSEYEHDNTQ